MKKFNWDEFQNKYNMIAVHCKNRGRSGRLLQADARTWNEVV